ncbi:MAG: serine hydrolase domain-containing protein [Solimonas sp.]
MRRGRRLALIGSLVLLALLLAGAWKLRPVTKLAAAVNAQMLCDAAFVSGLDPAQVWRDQQLRQPGMDTIAWATRYEVDRERYEVRVRAAFAHARAQWRAPYGCVLADDDLPPSPQPPQAAQADAAIAEPATPALRAALDRAFSEEAERRQTKAVIVLDHGRVVAERYAPGYGPQTRLWGHSDTKSVMSTAVGLLVQDGRLKTADTVPAWRDSGDARATVTIDQLLRMTSGLRPDEVGDDLVNDATRLWFLSVEPSAFALSRPLVAEPGADWAYSNVGYTVLSRVVRDAVGGNAQAMDDFLRERLFGPLGMHSAQLTLDRGGTPVGSGYMFATARDWARFGQFYLDDGVVDGQRLLPQGWVAYATTPTLATGYGAGWWTNRVSEGEIPFWGAPWGLPGLPEDVYFCRGAWGQFVVVVPSRGIVVARFGLTFEGGAGMGQLVRDVLDAIPADAASVAAPAGAPQ